MFKSLDIQKGMEVVGLDSKHVWVDYVDQKVHLNKPSTKATSEWQAAA
jgi:hypothetical protein